MIFDDETITMSNPNLYITLASSDYSAYLLREDSGLLLLENGMDGLLF